MPPEVIAAIIAGVQAIAVAVIGGLIQRNAKKTERYREQKEEQYELRKKRDKALYELVFADSTGTEILLHQAHGDHLNGNVEAAREKAKEARDAYRAFIHDQAAHNVAK